MEKLFELEKLLLNFDTRSLTEKEFDGFMIALKIVHEFNDAEFKKQYPELAEVETYEI